jgi:hypothetical protein
MFRVLFDFRGMCAFEAGNISGVFNESRMHAITDAKIGHAMLTGITGSENFTFETTPAESTGN